MGRYLEFSRPFTLVAPALGFFSGGLTAIGAAPREAWSGELLLYPLMGALMAAVLNAASNALNQIYDLEIDRVNKPKRPLPSGRLSLREAWTFTWVAYAIALVLAWLVAPGGRHECFWIVVARHGDHLSLLGAAVSHEAIWESGPTSPSPFRAACC